MAEQVDAQDLKSCNHNGCAGSIPAPGTSNYKISPEITEVSGLLLLVCRNIAETFLDLYLLLRAYLASNIQSILE
jgi:hypothetical protein